MCEIQFSMKLKKKLNVKDKREFLKLLRKGAKYNNDAYGIFSKDYIQKEGMSFEDRKLNNITAILKDLPSTSFLVGHNRLATQGNEQDNKNNHPFETKNWLVVHNGILYNDKELKYEYKLDYDEQTDSAIIIHLLEHFEMENEVDTLRLVAEMLGGSFSVVAYSKKTDTLYYFKCGSTSFYFGLVIKDGESTIIGSTNETSIDNSYTGKNMIFDVLDYDDKSIVEAEKGLIYRITSNDGISVACDFEPTTYNNLYTGHYCKTGYNDTTVNKRLWYDWNGEYPDLDIVMREFITEVELYYGDTLDCDENIISGTIWFRIEEHLRQNMLYQFDFGVETPKGIKFEIDDIYDYLAKKLKVGTYREEKTSSDYSEIDDYHNYIKDVEDKVIKEHIAIEKSKIKDYNQQTKAMRTLFADGNDMKKRIGL